MITFIAGANSITVNPPQYGYDVEINLPMQMAVSCDSQYSFFDPPDSLGVLGTYDYRVLKNIKWKMPLSQQIAFQEFFRNAIKGRCENITMRMDASRGGFYPAGTDKGDTGDFIVRLTDQAQSGMLHKPWKYFENELEFVIITCPSYTLPAQVTEGHFQIGTVSGLRYPQNGFNIDVQKNFSHVVTQSGLPYAIDEGSTSDTWISSFDIEANESKSAALIAFMTGTSGRGSDITITSANTNVFGAEKSTYSIFTTKMIGYPITITHNRKGTFALPLKFWLKSAA